MAGGPKVSVISIAYNHEKYIKEALDSFVMQQTAFAFEVIVADDCSTDKTQDIIREYADRHPRIIKPILRTTNVGAQRNGLDALHAASGEYIALCEGDDYWIDRNKLQVQADFLDENPGYALCFHLVRVSFDNRARKDYVFPDVDEKTRFTAGELLKRNFIQTNAVMYRRQRYEDLPSDILPMDWYLHAYHARLGKIGFVDKVMSVYRRHETSMWWEADNDIDEIWKRHGLSHLRLYIEFLKLYGSNRAYRRIIEKHISELLENFRRVDSAQHTALLERAVRELDDYMATSSSGGYQAWYDWGLGRQAKGEGQRPGIDAEAIGKNEASWLRRSRETIARLIGKGGV